MRVGIGIAVLLLATPFLPAQESAVQRADAIGAEPVVSDYDEPPKLLKQTKPKYPKDAFKKKVEGVVLVEFIVDEKGRVALARILKSVPELDRAAVDAVKAWRFAPATQKGVPVRVLAQAPVTFCIDRSCLSAP